MYTEHPEFDIVVPQIDNVGDWTLNESGLIIDTKRIFITVLAFRIVVKNARCSQDRALTEALIQKAIEAYGSTVVGGNSPDTEAALRQKIEALSSRLLKGTMRPVAPLVRRN